MVRMYEKFESSVVREGASEGLSPKGDRELLEVWKAVCLGFGMADGKGSQCLGRGSELEHGEVCISYIAWLWKFELLWVLRRRVKWFGLLCERG